jgi:hypothetical protein
MSGPRGFVTMRAHRTADSAERKVVFLVRC